MTADPDGFARANAILDMQLQAELDKLLTKEQQAALDAKRFVLRQLVEQARETCDCGTCRESPFRSETQVGCVAKTVFNELLKVLNTNTEIST